MLLAIDAGNTNVVFALVQNGHVVQRWRISTERNRTADDYMVWLHQLLVIAEVDKRDITHAIIATVVPPALFNLKQLCRSYFNIEPLVVGEPDCKLDLTINMPNPAEVGADRLVNAIAAHHAYGGNLIIVDFGTATTFDVVNAQGDYEGGVIAPGINLSMDALYAAAAKLPRIAVEPPQTNGQVIGKSTVQAMQSGVFWGYVGLIEGLAARIRAEIKADAKVIGTGGLAVLFDTHTNIFHAVDGDLTVNGLALIHARNQQK
jgi:type III pantothenate kinase